MPYAGTYTAKATYNGVSSNAVTVEVSTKGATYTGTVKFIRLSISVDSGSAVVLTDSSGTTIKSYTQGSNAELVYLSALGTYTASASLSGETTSGSVNCSAYGDFTLALAYRALDQTMLSTIASAVSAGNLNNVSWSTLSSISDALESDKCTDDDIIEAKKLLKLYKTVAYNSTTTVYCHIIGVLQDHLGSEKRGFTMWVTATATPLSTSSKALHITSSAINTSNTNSGGWGDSNVVRPALQSGGSIYKLFDTSLTDVIKSKTTYYGANYSSTSSAVADIEDKMFLLSGYEVYGESYSTSYGYYANEGTGASHNEQYQLFANEGITRSNCSKLSCSSYCWLRSVYYSYSGNFLIVYTVGSLVNSGHYGASNSLGCCPAFCI